MTPLYWPTHYFVFVYHYNVSLSECVLSAFFFFFVCLLLLVLFDCLFCCLFVLLFDSLYVLFAYVRNLVLHFVYGPMAKTQ